MVKLEIHAPGVSTPLDLTGYAAYHLTRVWQDAPTDRPEHLVFDDPKLGVHVEIKDPK